MEKPTLKPCTESTVPTGTKTRQGQWLRSILCICVSVCALDIPSCYRRAHRPVTYLNGLWCCYADNVRGNQGSTGGCELCPPGIWGRQRCSVHEASAGLQRGSVPAHNRHRCEEDYTAITPWSIVTAGIKVVRHNVLC